MTTKEIYRLNSLNVEEINRLLQRLQDRLDKIEGWRGTPEFQTDISLKSNKVTEVADATADTDSPNFGQTAEGVLTTRGDLIYRDATTVTRLALGAANRFLGSDGTDAAWTDPTTVLLATQAQMEAATSNAVFVTPGRVHYHPGVPKGWVVFDGTGTLSILDSYNISSVTDAGTGSYTPNLATAFSSTSFATNISADAFRPRVREDLVWTTSSIRVETYNSAGALADSTYVSVSFFGDQ